MNSRVWWIAKFSLSAFLCTWWLPVILTHIIAVNTSNISIVPYDFLVYSVWCIVGWLVGMIIQVIGGEHNGGYDEFMNLCERWIDDFCLIAYWWGLWLPVLLTSKSPFILEISKTYGNIYHCVVGTLVGIMSFCYILHFWLWVSWWVWWAMYFVVGIMVDMLKWVKSNDWFNS